MSRKKDDILIKLIKKVPLDAPSAEFTDAVLEQLLINLEQELSEDQSVADLIIESDNAYPTENLTDNILTQLKETPSARHLRPIISKKAVVLFTVSLVALTILSFLGNGSATTSESGGLFNFEFFNELLSKVPQDSSILVVCLISISSLLFIDYIYKNKQYY